MRNLQEQVEKAFCYQKLIWPFTVWINCFSDLKIFEISRSSASNLKSFSQSLEQFFLTVGENNFGNKIPFFFTGFDNTTAVIGSAEQYYDYSVLKKIDDISGGIGMPDLKLTACLAACYLVLFLTLWKGSSFIYFLYFF